QLVDLECLKARLLDRDASDGQPADRQCADRNGADGRGAERQRNHAGGGSGFGAAGGLKRHWGTPIDIIFVAAFRHGAAVLSIASVVYHRDAKQTLRGDIMPARASALPRILLALGALVAAPVSAQAQTYPDRAIKIVVPIGPAGSYDIVGRLLADQ